MDQSTFRIDLGRRELLGLAGSGLLVAAAGCDVATDPVGEGPDSPAGESPDSRQGDSASKGKEAPELAELVDRGELPPVEERLPATPLVVEPADRAGQYGGEWNRLILRDGMEGWELYTTIGYEQLLRWRPGASDLTPDQVIPNVAEDLIVNDDGTEFTFRLREGLKWSDGEPFTADDIIFWWDDVASNRELTPGTAGAVDDIMRTVDGLGTVEKEDDHTVVFRFPAPHGLFLVSMASPRGAYPTSFPAHYMKQFHKDYNEDVEEQAQREGFDDWMAYFWSKGDIFLRESASDRPTLNAWILTSDLAAETTRLTAERNPYYWKTDPDGSQLPYIGSVVYDIFEEEEAAVLRVASGEIDTVDRGITHDRNKPVFSRDRDAGGYDFFDTVPQPMNHMIIMLNLTHQDPMMREVFNNKDFRVGLSHAINRLEIIDVVYQRQGEPWQASPRRGSPYFSERLAKQYTEYDPELANELLDGVLPETNSDGIRLAPDGTPVSFQVDTATVFGADKVDALELVQQYWRDIGIDMRIKNEDIGLWVSRTQSNQHDAAVHPGHGGLGSILDRFFWVPYGPISAYAVPWDHWFRQPESELAEEPPQSVKGQFEFEQQIFTATDQQEQTELMLRLLDSAADQFYCMGIALVGEGYGIVSDDLHSTPDHTLVGYLYGDMMPTNPQQYFFA